MSESPPRVVTIKEVAQASGVSIGAVSKVLHGRGGNIRVSEATAQRIRDAAKGLSYRPNYHARSLRSGRSGAIGLASAPAFTVAERGLYHAYLMDALTHRLTGEGYTLHFSPELLPLTSAESLSDGRFDGVVWVDTYPEGDLAKAFVGSPIPVVAINGLVDEIPARGGWFATDEAQGARVALDHLAAFGHRSVGYVRAPAWRSDPLDERRWLAVKAAAEDSGFAIAQWGDVAPDEVVSAWRANSAPPTAIVCANDATASGFLDAAFRAGFSAPEAVSVLSLDGTPYTELLCPSLTSVLSPVDDLVERAVSHLVSQIAGTVEGGECEMLPCTLAPSRTTGPVPA